MDLILLRQRAQMVSSKFICLAEYFNQIVAHNLISLVSVIMMKSVLLSYLGRNKIVSTILSLSLSPTAASITSPLGVVPFGMILLQTMTQQGQLQQICKTPLSMCRVALSLLALESIAPTLAVTNMIGIPTEARQFVRPSGTTRSSSAANSSIQNRLFLIFILLGVAKDEQD